MHEKKPKKNRHKQHPTTTLPGNRNHKHRQAILSDEERQTKMYMIKK